MVKIDWFKEMAERLEKPVKNGLMLIGFRDENFWCDGEKFMCKNENTANFLADMFEALYSAQGEDVTIVTGYYDPENGIQNNVVDSYTGLWYVETD